MELQIQNERAVSPVIGVILMVAVTVILASVIGAFVLSIGGDIEKAPQTSISIDDDNYLVHQGGDTIDGATIIDGNGNTVAALDGFEPGDKSTTQLSEDTIYRVFDNSSGQIIFEGEA